VWLRANDVRWFADNIVPNLKYKISIITGDSDRVVPDNFKGGHDVLNSPWIEAWYAQNKAVEHPKLHAIPIGIPIHYGFAGSLDSVHTVQTMANIREKALPFKDRKKTIIYDKGTMHGGNNRRNQARTETYNALSKCSNIEHLEKQPPPDFWRTLASHQFEISPTGVGWDTFRLWELLFFGTIPIVKKSPLDLLLMPAHVPVLIVEDWSEVCTLTADKYEAEVRGCCQKV
jgi:hypothetical protein